MDSLDSVGAVDQSVAAEAAERLRGFRGELYGCLGPRADELFELTDALLCADGPVRTLVGLCLTPEHRRGHGALYDALNHGQVDDDRLRRALVRLPVPRMFGGRIVLAVDATPWLRPDAPTCPDRLFCHVYGRGRLREADQQIPGWPYQLVVALESGPTSWTAALDVVRLGPADDVTAVTAAQLRAVLGRLRTAGHWQVGDPPIMVVLDSGYDVCRLAFVLADLPVHLVGRLRADRVLLGPACQRPADGPGPVGRPRRHGTAMTLADPATWLAPTTRSTTDTPRYGQAEATGWDRMHPRLTHRGAWAGHPGTLPIVEGTLIRLQVEHLPGQRGAKPVWLWSSHTAADSDDDLDALAAEVVRCWQAYLRRFDEEHTIRLFKQTLGWTAPRIRSPQAADRWTWLIIAAYTQLRLARPLAADLRRPWERPLRPDRLTPARVRRGFRYLRAKTTQPASAPKPTHPGPGRPPGVTNRHRATRYDVGKTVKRDTERSRDPQVRG
ncbi:NF041680 family putative transposase [Geodermatophilus chilensis]|uniref:NF041680 family putative transposase n=1 Tax=Geodermatophilus chilensis TaxID=2035835 RepID=UPI001E4C1794|nr:NF041680 family putative transposase [Geodermatophilus chilensis]